MKISLRSIGEILAILSVVLSLIFVGYELRMNRSIAFNDSYGQTSEITTNVNAFIAEHPDTWRRGCVGETLSDDEEVIFIRLIASWDNLNYSRYQRASSGITLSSPERWVRSTALNMYRYPGFHDYWIANQRSLSTDNAIRGELPLSGYAYDVIQEYNYFQANGAPEIMKFACGNY